tara:strand:+ start:265 stop:699 length:435 start_codon:yes stop_codon:yes gene_type:complete
MPSQIKVDEIKNVAGQYKIKTNVFEGQTTAGSVAVQSEGTATTNLQQGLAKAWVAGEADAQRSDSFNMSGSTDHTDGDFSYNLSSNFSTIHYAQSGIVEVSADAKTLIRNTDRQSTSAIAVEVVNNSNTNQNYDHDVVAHGDLA